MLGGFEQIFGMMGGLREFRVQLRCYSMTLFPRADTPRINAMNNGGNILLPNSALDHLTRLNVQYPLLFKISGLSLEHQRSTHAGVLEFLAEEGKCYLPSWMIRQLGFMEGELAAIEYRSLPLATYAKFKPMSTDFLNISNPRAILEVELRKFRCLTKNDVISISYNDQVLEFKVMNLKPGNAVSITECDVNLEFDAPDGYSEPTTAARTHAVNAMPEAPQAPVKAPTGWAAFSGQGVRLDGKSGDEAAAPSSKASTGSTPSNRSIADTEKEKVPATVRETTAVGPAALGESAGDEHYEPGYLKFIRYNYKNRAFLLRELRQAAVDGGTSGSSGQKLPTPFTGSGFTLRSS